MGKVDVVVEVVLPVMVLSVRLELDVTTTTSIVGIVAKLTLANVGDIVVTGVAADVITVVGLVSEVEELRDS